MQLSASVGTYASPFCDCDDRPGNSQVRLARAARVVGVCPRQGRWRLFVALIDGARQVRAGMLIWLAINTSPAVLAASLRHPSLF
jgi:hypothetical protein